MTDQHYAAVVTFLAQGPGRDTSSHPRPENDHRFLSRGHNPTIRTKARSLSDGGGLTPGSIQVERGHAAHPRMIGSLGTWVITSGASSVMIDVSPSDIVRPVSRSLRIMWVKKTMFGCSTSGLSR